ncbi:MAG: hypothetical protein ACPGXK_16530 [Phycisphaerae bacterium]
MPTVFDQAIFTSVRTPMGEGYRVIASSPGVKPDEKQAMTRMSPSHKGLCLEHMKEKTEGEFVPGLAFYPLPSGRLCLAVSTFAGAEHTARGGQRIYTHNLIFSESSLADWQFNPLEIARAALAQGCTEPQLKPEKLLPTIELNPTGPDIPNSLPDQVDRQTAKVVLNNLLLGKRTVIHLANGWFDALEALMMGIPGPMRGRLSFSAGLQFSVSRTHHLVILNDEPGHAKKRSVGQPVSYFQAHEPHAEACDAPSSWLAFVCEHWEQNDMPGLARRTNRSFASCEAEALFAMGESFNLQVSARRAPISDLVEMADRCHHAGYLANEPDIARETRNAVQSAMLDRIRTTPWNQMSGLFDAVGKWWSADDTSASFCAPIMVTMMQQLGREDTWRAVDKMTALLADGVRPGVQHEWEQMVDQLITDVARVADDVEEANAMKLQRFVGTWAPQRPNSPAMKVIQKQCETLLSATQEAG